MTPPPDFELSEILHGKTAYSLWLMAKSLSFGNIVTRSNPPLPVMHDDLTPLKINVLDPQSQSLHQPQPRAIQQPAEQPVSIRHGRQPSLHLCLGQHHRHPRRTPRPVDNPSTNSRPHLECADTKTRGRSRLGSACWPTRSARSPDASETSAPPPPPCPADAACR